MPSDYRRVATRFGETVQIFGMDPTALLADEISTPGDDQIRSFVTIAGNPVLSGPGGDALESALESLDIFFSIDFYIDETNRYADYILPATTFLEREDIPVLGMSHMPRPFIQYTDAVIEPRGESHTEVDILSELAERLRRETYCGHAGNIPRRDEHFELLDHLLKAADWPSVEMLKEHPHGMLMGELTRSDWKDKLSHEDRKLHLWHPMLEQDFAAMRRYAPESRALLLFGRRDIRSINSWAHNVDRLVRSQTPRLLMHPQDAEERNIADGELGHLSGPGGTIDVEVSLSNDIVRGAVSYPHGWGHRGGWARAVMAGGANINRIVERELVEPILFPG